jgi:hypothetical protein
MENKIQKKENNSLISKSEFESRLNILVEGQTNNSKQLQAIRNDLQKGFIGLALRNEELLKSNDQLKQQLEIVVDKLNAIGYIIQLWKDSKEIEFVKQSIGHQKLDTISAYVNKLSNQERQKRIDRL